MCTVSYLPGKGNCYILTSNRDESIQRPNALTFNPYRIGDRTVYFPKDPQAGGTWIATTGDSATLCLLNGGFEPHTTPKGHHYKISRGQMLLSYFKHQNAADFIQHYSFKGIEPFTLIVIENQPNQPKRLLELRWTGTALHQQTLDEQQPHIWSSVTLYPETVRLQRKQWFAEWLLKYPHNQESILDFHLFAGNGENMSNLVMDIGDKRTVSICSIDYSAGLTKTVYKDLCEQASRTYLVYH